MSDLSRYRLLGPPTPSADLLPLIICFHGSGQSSDSPSQSWLALGHELAKTWRVLLYARGDAAKPLEAHTKELLRYLRRVHLVGPYVLVAHSHGGTFARHLLHCRPACVVGMVLVETGQETPLPNGIEQRQYSGHILGTKPMVVIRANSLIALWRNLELAEAVAVTNQLAIDPTRRTVLEQADAEDERLKRAQLALSECSKYVAIPDCGHDVIHYRPDVVVTEVGWVLEQIVQAGGVMHGSRGGIFELVDRIRENLCTLAK